MFQCKLPAVNGRLKPVWTSFTHMHPDIPAWHCTLHDILLRQRLCCLRPRRIVVSRLIGSAQMVALLPSCLRCGAVQQQDEASCAAAVMASCSATAPLQCFQQVAERRCGVKGLQNGTGDASLG